jgi:hypothetical protein
VKVRFGCSKFHRLWNAQDERDLSSGEERFLNAHLSSCESCSEFVETCSKVLNLLREATLEPEVSTAFDDRVLRRARVQIVRESLGYWSPALIGAAIACVAIFASLQIATTPGQLQEANLPGGEAKRDVSQDDPLPSLILREDFRLDP